MNSASRVIWASATLLATGFVALLVIVGMTFHLAEGAQLEFDSTVASRDLATAAVQFRYALQAAESSQRGYLASNNEIYLAPYGTAKTLAYQELQKLTKYLGEEQKASPATQRLVVVLDQKFQEMDSTIALKRDGHDDEALAVLRTNRGKSLMDEANVFISSIIRNADARLTENVQAQKEGLFGLRKIISASAMMILLVVTATLAMIVAFARNLGRASNEVAMLNSDLERRVEERTVDLTAARNRAEVLLAEVNHRVGNSLALVASMVGLQARASESEETRMALSETQTRIAAIALVHKQLYGTGDVRNVALDSFLLNLLEQLEVSMRDTGHLASLKPHIASLSLPTDKSISLGVIAAEWVTNAFKYAYPGGGGEIRVSLTKDAAGLAELRVDDDGVGRMFEQKPQGTGLGTKLVNAMAASLGGHVEYVERLPGTSARLTLPTV